MATQVAVFGCPASFVMLDKEAFCLIAQAIYDDLLLSLAGQGSLRRHFVQPTVTAHKIFLIFVAFLVLSTRPIIMTT